MNHFQNNLGSGYQTAQYIVFFGGINAELSDLQSFYKNLSFLRVKQTHSDITVVASEKIIEADAHYSSLTNSALLIATADCMPIMVYCKQTKRIAAIHAGWRGVVNKITEKTLIKLIASGSSHKNFSIFIGPSILSQSFEVDLDVFEKLSQSGYGLDQLPYYSQQGAKYFVNLNQIVNTQIKKCTDGLAQVTFSEIDTKTNLNYHSYRRGKQSSQRNLSFIAQIS